MQVEHHDLHHEFPEYLDVIHALKAASEPFGTLYDDCLLYTSRCV